MAVLGQPESQVRLTFFSQEPPDVSGTNIPSHLFGSQDKAYQKDQVATLSMEKSFSHPTWRKEPWAEGHLLQTFFKTQSWIRRVVLCL